MFDRVSVKRIRKGEKRGFRAKLTVEQVQLMDEELLSAQVLMDE
jgi:hypothetical protein